MSFVTRCTSCGTLFKVVADQLKISNGWVRCGQCGSVFDAQQNAMPDPEAPPAQVTALPAESAVAPSAEPEPSPTPSPSAHEEPPAHPELVKPVAPTAAPESSEDSRSEPSKSSDFTDSTGWPVDEGELMPELKPGDSAHPELDETPTFIAQAQRAARWQSPAVRLALLGVISALAVALAAQVALQERDRVAAQWPQSKPWLERLCRFANCQIQAFKQIEAITVDASSFNRDQRSPALPDSALQTYSVGVTLKNIGTLPVALPHIELSLQDSNEQTILRRVLSPAQLGMNAPSLGAAQDLSGKLSVQIDAAKLAGGRVQGYRILAFYP
jgi:predicted Zn finger-like uncharacterized protein